MNMLFDININFKKNRNYYYIILNCSDGCDYVKEAAIDYFENGYVYSINNDLIIFYPDEEMLCEEFYDIVQSLCFDLEIKVKYFKGIVVNKDNFKDFNKIYEIYRKYTLKKYSYSTMSELIAYILVKDSLLLKDLKDVLIGAILKDEQLVKLVLALADNNLNVTKTAKAMYMHRNTINNKLEYIKKETGLDIQNFNDIYAVYSLIKFI